MLCPLLLGARIPQGTLPTGPQGRLLSCSAEEGNAPLDFAAQAVPSLPGDHPSAPDLDRLALQCLPPSVHLFIPGPAPALGSPTPALPGDGATCVSSLSGVSYPQPPEGGVPRPQPRATVPSPEPRVGHVGSISEDCPLGSSLMVGTLPPCPLCPQPNGAGNPLARSLLFIQMFSSLNAGVGEGLPFRRSEEGDLMLLGQL